MPKFWGALLGSWVVLLGACGGGPAVLGSDDVPVRRVVLYRNGVAYFERSGQVSGDELHFGVRQSEVGDFLSSLTVVERTAGGVSSVSFDVPEPPPPAPPIEPLVSEEEDAQIAPPPVPEEPDDPRVDVTLRLRGEHEHEMMVAYVVGSPIWRPSYRVVLDDDDALLQAWAVVQNTSGEDWRDVELSLTTGTPIAFRSDLGTPVTPERPQITDTGDVVMAVPTSETALAQAPPPAPPAAEPVADYAEGEEMALEEEQSRGDGRARGPARAESAAAAVGGYGGMPAPAPADSPFGAGVSANLAAQSVTAMAAAAVLGDGVTRYDLRERVTVPDGGSTMVAILSSRVPGREAHLFAPDPGVPTSATHPFRVVRIENRTGATLERGPISVLGHGSFLGQGVLEPLPREATTFVPFAVDRSIAVQSSERYTEADAALVRVTQAEVIVERFSERRTKYRIQNGGEDASEVFLRHFRMPNGELHEPPEGTEESPDRALVPVRVRGHATREVELVERTPVRRTVHFLSDVAAEAIGLYLSGAAVDAAQGPALTRALELRRQLVTARTERDAAQREKNTLAANADETRRNLEAVRTLRNAGDLRQRLVQRLSDLDARIADLTRRIVDTDTNISELEVRLSEALQDVSLVVRE
jgi:hypothetical protein